MVLEIYYAVHKDHPGLSVQENEMVNEKKIAFLDFDGTITREDSFPEIIKFQKRKFVFYAGLLLNLPWFIGFFSIISNDRFAPDTKSFYKSFRTA